MSETRTHRARRRTPALLASMLTASLAISGAAADPLDDIEDALSDAVCAMSELSPHVCAADELWSARYDGPNSYADGARTVGVSPDGSRVFVAGRSLGFGTGYDYAVIAYNAADGTRLWVASYNGTGNGDDGAASLEVSQDGSRVYVTGASAGAGTGTDYLTIAFDAADGAALWSARYDGPASGGDTVRSVALTPDGSRVIVGGHSTGVGTGADFTVVAYDAADGAEAWVARYDGPAHGSDAFPALALSSDGARLFLNGYSTGVGTGVFDYATVAIDVADGSELWAARYNGPTNGGDYGDGVHVSLDGTLVFATGRGAGALGSESTTIAYRAGDGSQVWIDRYAGVGNNDGTRTLATTPDGSRLFVGGYSRVGANNDAIVIAYDAAGGERLWTSHYDAEGHDGVQELVATADGSRIYATGQSQGTSTRNDAATLALDAADGSLIWVGRYDGPAHRDETAYDLALSPDGSRVFVTGESPGAGTDNDAFTVAYGSDVAIPFPV